MSDDAYIPPSERRITSNESITVQISLTRQDLVGMLALLDAAKEATNE